MYIEYVICACASTHTDSMRHYDKDAISERVISELEPIMADPAFTPEAMVGNGHDDGMAVSAAITGWARSVFTYNGLFKEVAPLRLECKEVEAKHGAAKRSADEVQRALKEELAGEGGAG